MKSYLYLTILLLFFTSCNSVPKLYVGSEATRVAEIEFPSKQEWALRLNEFSESVNSKNKPIVLWNIGLYSSEGVSFNFPLNGDSEDYSLDFNESYLNYFSRNKIDVLLSLELDSTDNFEKYVDLILNRYGDKPCIKGICLDLEWLEDKQISSELLDKWSIYVTKINKKYILALKEWNPEKLDSNYSSNLIFLMNAEGLGSIDEVTLYLRKWYRKFYPSRIGVLLGSKSDKYLEELPEENPQNYILEKINSKDISLGLFIWNISTFF